MTHAEDVSPALRQELGRFLRARRAALRPEDVGLHSGHSRRVPGLRREEVALLASVSHTWYMELEQGRNVHPTAAVLEALARALRLDEDERRHLWFLADLPQPGPRLADALLESRLQQIVDKLCPWPAYVLDPHLDFQAANRGQWNLFGPDVSQEPGRPTNAVVRGLLDPNVRLVVVDWEAAAQRILAQFRANAGQQPNDLRFAEIQHLLQERSEDFRRWWPEYVVRNSRPGATAAFDHPVAGRIHTTLTQYVVADSPDLTLFVQVPCTEVDKARLAQIDTG